MNLKTFYKTQKVTKQILFRKVHYSLLKAANFEFEWVQFSRIIVSPLISNFQNNSWKRFLRNFITLSAREQVCNFFKKCALRCWDWDASICLQCCNTKPLSLSSNSTVWKFQDFTITQILREINFEDSWRAKSVISPHLEVLKSDYYDFVHFLNAENYQINKFTPPKMPKNVSFCTARIPKIDFT